MTKNFKSYILFVFFWFRF